MLFTATKTQAVLSSHIHIRKLLLKFGFRLGDWQTSDIPPSPNSNEFILTSQHLVSLFLRQIVRNSFSFHSAY